jgi:membrane-associated phospholipid phosphatase
MNVRARLASLSLANRFALTATLGAVVVFSMYLFFVRTGLGQQIDQAIHWVGSRVAIEITEPLRGPLGIVSNTSIALGGATAMGIAWLRRRWWLGFAIGGMVIGANVTTQLLKRVILERPDLLDGSGLFANNSLPSGHVTAAATVAIAFVLAASYRTRIWVATLAFLAIAYAGVAVVATNYHFPSDSIAAIGVVMAWAGAAGWFVATVGGTEDESANGGQGIDTASSVLAAVIAVLGGIVIIGVLLMAAREPAAGLDVSRSSLAFVISSSSIVAFAAVLLLALLFSMRDVSLDRRH